MDDDSGGNHGAVMVTRMNFDFGKLFLGLVSNFHASSSATVAAPSTPVAAAVPLAGGALAASILKAALPALPDVLAAISNKLADIPDDEAVLSDAVAIAVAIDPELMPLEIAVPVLEWLLAYMAANSQPAVSRAAGTSGDLRYPPITLSS